MTRAGDRLSTIGKWLDGSDLLSAEDALPDEVLRRRRDRRALASTAAAASARSLAMAASFLSIPLAIGYLGAERYGILAAVTSLTGILIFSDLGLGNGLLNLASDALARDDRRQVVRATASAFAMLVVIAIVGLVVFTLVYPRIDWAAVLNARSPQAVGEAGPSVAVVVVVFLIAIPFGLVERLRLAFQEGFVNSVAAAVGAFAALVALVVAIVAGADLPLLLAALVIPPVAALLLNGIALIRHRSWLRPRPSLVERSTALGLIRLGVLFLVLQVAIAVAFQSDVIVTAAVLGPEAAAAYAVTLKFFLVPPTFIGFYLAALWPAYTEAIARGDVAWIRTALRRSVLVAFGGSTAFALLLLAVGPWLLPTWTGGAIRPPFELLIGAALWSILLTTFTAISMLLNAASVVTFQVVTATLMACASIIASVVLAKEIGLPGVVFGTLGAYVVFSAIPIGLYVPRLMRRLSSSQAVTTHG